MVWHGVIALLKKESLPSILVQQEFNFRIPFCSRYVHSEIASGALAPFCFPAELDHASEKESRLATVQLSELLERTTNT